MSWYPEAEGAGNVDAITTRSRASLFQQYDQAELVELQQSDPDRKVIFRLKQQFQDRPGMEAISTASRTTKLYFTRWDQIILEGGVLYRRWVE